MKTVDSQKVVITGIGLVTPLGTGPQDVLRRIETGDSAGAPPTGFDSGLFACPVCAHIKDFAPRHYVAQAKMIRLMNRDAQLAVAAAHLALQDAQLKVGTHYLPEEIALYGSTGLVGLPLAEVLPLLNASSGPGGEFDLERFGTQGLKAVNPVLSFKILSNMALCFVSICENVQGSNGIFTPWEGQGAQAIEAGVRALESGDARCALVGGCDVKTHELAFMSLEQQGLFDSWRKCGAGLIPGEGAAFLVLEQEAGAAARGAGVYARLVDYGLRTRPRGRSRTDIIQDVLEELDEQERSGPATGQLCFSAVLASDNGDPTAAAEERQALERTRFAALNTLCPKKQIGELFAAAAPLQVALGAALSKRRGGRVLINCFGHGSEQAAFVLQSA